MKLVIELTRGVIDACGDCECVAQMIAGVPRNELEKEFDREMPKYYFLEK